MARRPRVILPNVPMHVIQRGNNKQACFLAEDDYHFYLEWLADYAAVERVHIHAYVLMTNHAHVLLTADTAAGPGRLMKRLGQRYVQYINRTYRRSGTLWEGRYRSCMTQEESYVLGCYRYIELNPVRASMVEHPADYPWSSYRVNGQGEPSTLIRPHLIYDSLGKDKRSRQRAYRELFRYELDPGLIDQIRRATHGNYVLGSERFEDEVASMLDRRVSPGTPGRPSKKA